MNNRKNHDSYNKTCKQIINTLSEGYYYAIAHQQVKKDVSARHLNYFGIYLY
ncbi:MAG: hypothetical protein JXB88_00585 [Spirochaetales bacterium]|nr:hypothetical protein [Spirochaetales bacterium]